MCSFCVSFFLTAQHSARVCVLYSVLTMRSYLHSVIDKQTKYGLKAWGHLGQSPISGLAASFREPLVANDVTMNSGEVMKSLYTAFNQPVAV